MRLSGFQINSFGVLREQRVEGLSPGISVFLGDNEAGKSTLLRFFQAMLFGFKRGGTFLDTLNGGKDGGGGLLFLETESLGPVSLHGAPRLKEALLRDAAGLELPAAALDRLTTGMTQAVFDAVFAFDLARLTGFSDRKDEVVRNALHGAAFGTGFTSPAGVLRELDERKKNLLKAARGQAPLNLRLKELEETLADLAGRRPPLAEWEAVQAELAEAAESLARNVVERERVQRALSGGERLAADLKQWAALRGLEVSFAALAAEGPLPPPQAPDAAGRLAALETELKNTTAGLRRLLTELESFSSERRDLAPRPELAALAAPVASLRERKEMFRAHNLDHRALEREMQALEGRRREILDRLGPAWSEEAVLAADTSPAGLDILSRTEKSLREAENLHAERARALECLLPPIKPETPLPGEVPPADLPTENEADALTAHLALAVHALDELPGVEAARRRADLEYARALDALRPLPEEAALRLDEAARVRLAQALAGAAEAGANAERVERDVARMRETLDEVTLEHADASARRERLGPGEAEEDILGRIAALRRLDAELRELAALRQAGALRPGASFPLFALACAGLFFAGVCLGVAGPLLGVRDLLLTGLVVAGIGAVGLAAAFLNRRRGAAGQADGVLREREAAADRRLAELGDILDGRRDAVALATALERQERVLRLQQDIRRADEEVLRAEQRRARARAACDDAAGRLEQAGVELRTAGQKAGGVLAGLGYPPGTPPGAAAGLFERVEILRARRQAREDAEESLRGHLRVFSACREAAVSLPFFAAVLPAEGGEPFDSPAPPVPLDGPRLDSLRAFCRSLEQACAHLNTLRREARKREAGQAALLARAAEADRARELLCAAEDSLCESREAWAALLRDRGFDPALTPEAVRASLELQKDFAALTRTLGETAARRDAAAAFLEAFAVDLGAVLGRAGLEAYPGEAGASAEEVLRSLDALGAVVDKALADDRECARLDSLIAAKAAGVEEARAALALAEADLATLFAGAGVGDAASFRLALDRRGRFDALTAERLRIEAALAGPAERAGLGLPEYLARLAATDAGEVRRRDEAFRAELRGLEEEAAELAGRQGALGERADALRRSDGTAPLLQKAEDLRADLRGFARQWCVPALARHFLEQAKAEFEQRGRDGIIGRAGSLFAEITAGEYLGIAPRLEGDGFSFTALHKSGAGRDPETALSRGAREQLYLALRLAFIRHHADHAEPLPAIMDDILVNFDPGRAANTARVLARFARDNQILFFTCRPEQADLLMEAGTAEGGPTPALFPIHGGDILPGRAEK